MLALVLTALFSLQAAWLPMHLAAHHHPVHADCHAGDASHEPTGSCGAPDHDEHAHASADHSLDRARRLPALLLLGLANDAIALAPPVRLATPARPRLAHRPASAPRGSPAQARAPPAAV